VDVSLNLPASAETLVIPDAAVGQNAQGHYVFVVKNDSTVEQRPIKVLRTTNDAAIVTGVQRGESIVVDGQSRLTPNAHVRIAKDKASA
jgi:multidrug efflux system membrane fusion protein